MDEPKGDEPDALAVPADQEPVVDDARECVALMVREAQSSSLHMPMVGLEMMAQGLALLTGEDVDASRRKVMNMFDDVEGEGLLVLRRIPRPPSTE